MNCDCSSSESCTACLVGQAMAEQFTVNVYLDGVLQDTFGYSTRQDAEQYAAYAATRITRVEVVETGSRRVLETY